jgi:hypothetical protein
MVYSSNMSTSKKITRAEWAEIKAVLDKHPIKGPIICNAFDAKEIEQWRIQNGVVNAPVITTLESLPSKCSNCIQDKEKTICVFCPCVFLK